MKTTQSILSQFEKTAGVWLASLSQYSEEQFAKKPNADSWSIGQVYNHLVAGTRLYPLQQIAQCLEGKQTEKNVGKKFPGKLTFFLGSFPPKRIKVPPSDTYTPTTAPTASSRFIRGPAMGTKPARSATQSGHMNLPSRVSGRRSRISALRSL